MKPIDKNQPLRSRLRSLALTTAMGAAMLLGTGTQARATLVGHWFSGAEELADTSGFTPAGTHDGIAVGDNAGMLAYSSDVPPGFTGKSLDLSAGNFAVQIQNTATSDGGTYLDTFDQGVGSQLSISFWAKGFPNNWAPWVSKRGENTIGWQVRRFDSSNTACFTMRGVANEDAGGSPINVNDNPAKWHHFVAVWDQATASRTLYVDGVLSHVVYNTPGQTTSFASNTHLVLGGRQGTGPGLDSTFPGLLFDVRIYNHALEQQDVFNLIPQLPPQNLAATPGSGQVHLTWKPSVGAARYTISTRNTVTNDVTTDIVTEPPFFKTGLSNGTAYAFKILGSNGGGDGAYTAEVNATPGPGTGKDILSFEFDGFGPAKISGTTITKYLPTTVDVTTLTASYTVSPFASEDVNFPSGFFRDFSTAQTYTITAENSTTKVYTVEVIRLDPLTYNFDTDIQGWTQIWPLPATANLWETGGLGTPEGPNADGAETRFGRSPDFFLNPSGPLTFQLAGGRGRMDTPNLSPFAIPATAISNSGFGGVALRDVATNSYVMAKRRSSDGPSLETGSFSEAELAPYVGNGKRYTLDFIDYNKGDWGWTRLDNVSIPGDLAPVLPPAPEANILEFALEIPSSIKMDGDNITITLPFGTALTAIAPTYTLSSGATCNRLSGSAQNFTAPLTYSVTSANSALTRVYTVTAVVMPDPALALVGHWFSGTASLDDTSGYTADGTHDGVAVGDNAGLLAFSTDVPPGFSGHSLDLRAGNVGVMINNSATTDGAGYKDTFDAQIRSQLTVSFWAKGFPGNWNPWVAKGGEDEVGWQLRRFDAFPVATFTIRGLGNPDGGTSAINVNQDPPVWHHYVGVWDEATGVRTLYVDGVLSHHVNTPTQAMTLAPGRHLALGARQNAVNGPFASYFPGLLYDVRIYKQKLFSNEVQALGASTSNFSTWINANHPGLSNKAADADPDGDGLSNFQEFAFGLNPASPASMNPIVVKPDKSGVFRYTRTNPAVSGLTYKVMVSTDLAEWDEDTAATAGQTVFSTAGDTQTMTVTLTGAPLTTTKLFVRVIGQ